MNILLLYYIYINYLTESLSKKDSILLIGGCKLTYKLACEDTGVSCPFVAEGETMDEMMGVAIKHVKAKHGYTDEQINSPEMQKIIKEAVKKD